MCDFSLEMQKSRAAVDGEDLILRYFPTGTNGFVSIADKDADLKDRHVCAVCLKEGVEMRLTAPKTEVQRRLAPGEYDAVFTNAKQEGFYSLHKDSVVIDGQRITLQEIPLGTIARVTKALPAELIEAVRNPAATDPDKSETQAREAVV